MKTLDNNQTRVDECLRVEWAMMWKTWDMLIAKMVGEFSDVQFLVISAELTTDPYESLYAVCLLKLCDDPVFPQKVSENVYFKK